MTAPPETPKPMPAFRNDPIHYINEAVLLYEATYTTDSASVAAMAQQAQAAALIAMARMEFDRLNAPGVPQ